MRIRHGNPHREMHDRPMRVYDWVLPPTSQAHAAVLAIEQAIPGLKLHLRGDGEVHGYVNASRRLDGSLYICVHLYDDPCDDVACETGHGGVRFVVHRALTDAELDGMKDATGEHAAHRLGVSAAHDHQVLHALGFQPPSADHPGDGPFVDHACEHCPAPKGQKG